MRRLIIVSALSLFLLAGLCVSATLREARSPHWATVRAEWLRDHPTCAACGTSDAVEVHHVQPFDARPDLELDRANLLTFCRGCHFNIGHTRNWQTINHQAREVAAYVLGKIEAARIAAKPQREGRR